MKSNNTGIYIIFILVILSKCFGGKEFPNENTNIILPDLQIEVICDKSLYSPQEEIKLDINIYIANNIQESTNIDNKIILINSINGNEIILEEWNTKIDNNVQGVNINKKLIELHKIKYLIPVNIETGEYVIKLEIDINNVIIESDENNNVNTNNNINIKKKLPDLKINNIKYEIKNEYYDYLLIDYEITNDGFPNLNIEGPIYYKISLVNESIEKELIIENINDLEYKENKKLKSKYYLTADIPFNNANIRISLDPTKEIDEIDENNNVMSSTNKIDKEKIKLPDLKPEIVVSKNIFNIDESIDIDYKVQNIGYEKTNSYFKNVIYLSPDNSIHTPSNDFLFTNAFKNNQIEIKANESEIINKDIQTSKYTPTGDFYLIAKTNISIKELNIHNTVTEITKNNNTQITSDKISINCNYQRSDLEPVLIEHEENLNPLIENQITIKIKNNGELLSDDYLLSLYVIKNQDDFLKGNEELIYEKMCNYGIASNQTNMENIKLKLDSKIVNYSEMYLYCYIDRHNQIMEKLETNNIYLSDKKITFDKTNLPDLTINNFQIESNEISCDNNVNIEYNIKNIDNTLNNKELSVYMVLSKDYLTTIDVNDFIIKIKTANISLQKNEDLKEKIDFCFPKLDNSNSKKVIETGNYYAFLYIDWDNKIAEVNEQNQTSKLIPLSINNNLPDFEISNVVYNNKIDCNNLPYKIELDVYNKGTASNTTNFEVNHKLYSIDSNTQQHISYTYNENIEWFVEPSNWWEYDNAFLNSPKYLKTNEKWHAILNFDNIDCKNNINYVLELEINQKRKNVEYKYDNNKVVLNNISLDNVNTAVNLNINNITLIDNKINVSEQKNIQVSFCNTGNIDLDANASYKDVEITMYLSKDKVFEEDKDIEFANLEWHGSLLSGNCTSNINWTIPTKEYQALTPNYPVINCPLSMKEGKYYMFFYIDPKGREHDWEESNKNDNLFVGYDNNTIWESSDIFEITREGTRFVIETFPSSNADVVDLKFEIYKADGSIIANSRTKSDNYSRFNGVLKSGTYYIKLYSDEGDLTGAYSIYYDNLGDGITQAIDPGDGTTNDVYDTLPSNDDTLIEAIDLNKGIYYYHTLTSGDVDWHKIIIT